MRVLGWTLGLGALIAATALAALALQDERAEASLPWFDAEGRLHRPTDYERWVFVGASIGLGYSDVTRQHGPGLFHHVYLEPSAYDHFRRHRSFPEGTQLVLEIHQPEEKVEPSKQGYFEGERIAVEVAVKDSQRFDSGWAYFDFLAGNSLAEALPDASCRQCHAQHARDDHVFTQFYPVLRRFNVIE